MSILLLLKNWKSAVMAGLTGITLILWGLLKYKSSELDKANDEIEAHEKSDEIQKEQKAAIEEVTSHEDDEIIEEVILNADKSRRDRADNF